MLLTITEVFLRIGVKTYDASKKNNFKMHATLMYIVSDILAYLILFRWSNACRIVCPYCKEDSYPFTLTKVVKQFYFDNY